MIRVLRFTEVGCRWCRGELLWAVAVSSTKDNPHDPTPTKAALRAAIERRFPEPHVVKTIVLATIAKVKIPAGLAQMVTVTIRRKGIRQRMIRNEIRVDWQEIDELWA